MDQISMKCWAAPLGNCHGPITQEHLFTKSLFKKRVTIKGLYAMPDGTCPQWLTKKGLDINIHKLTANILCKSHNQLLGKTADWTAINLQRALVATNEPMRHKRSKILKPPINRTISGVDYARWLCKTHCNIMAANGRMPSISYVQYAFGHRPESKIYFYTLANAGNHLKIGRGQINYTNYVDRNDAATIIFEITLAGLRMIVVPFLPDVEMMAKSMHLKSLMDRLRCIQQRTPLGWYRINFDWSNDPCL